MAFQLSAGNLGNHSGHRSLLCTWGFWRTTPLSFHSACSAPFLCFPLPYSVRIYLEVSVLRTPWVERCAPTLHSLVACHCVIFVCLCEGALNSVRAREHVLVICCPKPDTETDAYSCRYRSPYVLKRPRVNDGVASLGSEFSVRQELRTLLLRSYFTSYFVFYFS